MRLIFIVLTFALLVNACADRPLPSPAPAPNTAIGKPSTLPQVATVDPATKQLTSSVVQATSATTVAIVPPANVEVILYDPDPEHLWNRLYRHLYMRSDANGRTYGYDSLEPLLWQETVYLLQGPSHDEAIALLDEFLAESGETLIDDPLKRAMLQRDLWAVFDWSITPFGDKDASPRRALQERLAAVLRRLALPRQVIEGLLDNYQAAVDSNTFAAYQEKAPETPFLPPDLFAATNGWVNVGRDDGPMAETHLNSFWARSTFLVYYRLPSQSDATEAYLQALREAEQVSEAPPFQAGMEVALVRRLMLIDDQGNLVLSPLIESVQLRHAATPYSWQFYQFDLSRERLFAGQAGGLRAVTPGEESFAFFMSHGVDWFEFNQGADVEHGLFPPLQRCQSCHDGGLTQSIISYSRNHFSPSGAPLPVTVRETTPAREAQLTIEWKMNHESWQRLQALWH